MKLFGQWIPTYNQSIVIGIGGEYIGFEDYKYKLVNDFEKYPSNKYNFYANAFLNYSLNNLDSPSFEKKDGGLISCWNILSREVLFWVMPMPRMLVFCLMQGWDVLS